MSHDELLCRQLNILPSNGLILFFTPSAEPRKTPGDDTETLLQPSTTKSYHPVGINLSLISTSMNRELDLTA
jgi:hypothetical protein